MLIIGAVGLKYTHIHTHTHMYLLLPQNPAVLLSQSKLTG